MLSRTLAFAVVTALLLIAPGSTSAGPPCVCWPVDAGDAPVIDVGRQGTADSDVASRLLESLDNNLPILARMENLRRASNVLQDRPDQANYVLSRLLARVLNAETGKAQSPEKLWFDAGYAVACFRQAGIVSDLRGYRWITRALQLSGADTASSGGDGAMHYAAALAVLMPDPDHHMFGHHLQQMKEAAAKDELLAKSLQVLSERYPAVLRHFANK